MFVILNRETTRKACSVMQWLQSWPEKTGCLMMPCTAVCITGGFRHTWNIARWTSEILWFCTTSSKHVCDKLLILICHPVIWQDSESIDASSRGVHITSSHCCQSCPNWPLLEFLFEFHHHAFCWYTYEQFHSSCGFLIETTSGLYLAVRVESLQVKKKSQLKKN